LYKFHYAGGHIDTVSRQSKTGPTGRQYQAGSAGSSRLVDFALAKYGRCRQIGFEAGKVERPGEEIPQHLPLALNGLDRPNTGLEELRQH
jgi:hypothetical protein